MELNEANRCKMQLDDKPVKSTTCIKSLALKYIMDGELRSWKQVHKVGQRRYVEDYMGTN